ncbi:MAG: major facilitator superfamily 1 [Pseudonocardiales bacterium]|nr:major facilitator superfamily 1 [Pseudonocardiales bacterium]
MSDAARDTDAAYGRVIVGLAFCILGVAVGLSFYSMSAYIDALVSDRGFSLAVASAGPTFSSICGGVGGLITARLLKTVSTRLLLCVGAAGVGLTLAGIGSAQTVWQLWICFALSGFFGSMASGIPISALVARWFPTAPAKPLTIAMTGMALGGAIIPPAVLGVIGVFGLPRGSLILGASLIILVWSASVFIKEPPLSIQEAAKRVAPKSTRASVRDPLFAMLFGGMFFLFVSQIATSNHLVRLAKENNTHAAALAVTTLAIGALIGRLAGIPLMPAVGLRRIAVSVAITQAAGQFVLSGAYHAWSMLLGSFLIGFAMGNVAILQSLFAIEAYGLVEYPRMFARINLAAPIGGGLGPLLVALLHGSFGGYRWALVAMGVMSIIGGLILFSTGIDTESKLNRGGATKAAQRREDLESARADEAKVDALVD